MPITIRSLVGGHKTRWGTSKDSTLALGLPELPSLIVGRAEQDVPRETESGS